MNIPHTKTPKKNKRTPHTKTPQNKIKERKELPFFCGESREISCSTPAALKKRKIEATFPPRSQYNIKQQSPSAFKASECPPPSSRPSPPSRCS
jgi:hypothetical protein